MRPRNPENGAIEERTALFMEQVMPLEADVYRYALSLIKSHEDAQDLTQTTLMNAYRFISTYQAGTNLRAWIFTIFRNCFINEYRKRSKLPEFVDYTDFLKTDDKPVLDEDHRLGDELSRAMAQLSRKEQIAFILIYIQGYRYEEVAGIMDRTTDAIRAMLHKSKATMKSHMSKYQSARRNERKKRS